MSWANVRRSTPTSCATHTVPIDMKGNLSYKLPDGDLAKANIKAGFDKSQKHKGLT